MSTGAGSTGELAPDSYVWQDFSRVERVTGIEPALSAGEADAQPREEGAQSPPG